MGKIMRNNIEYGGTESWTGTQAEYDALLIKYPNITYYITDTNGNEDQFQPVIYSLDEREIGVWTDGKPLYEKSFAYDVSTNTTCSITVTSCNIDVLVNYALSGAGNTYYISNSDLIRAYIADANPVTTIVVQGGSSYPKTTGYLTIRYTKTTDTAGSGTWTPQGVPAIHYSTSEHVVGTWVDGKTIYEVSFPITNVVGPVGWVVIGTIADMDYLINGTVMVRDTSNLYNYSNLPVDQTVATGVISFYNNLGGHMGTLNGYATVRYTKSSS